MRLRVSQIVDYESNARSDDDPHNQVHLCCKRRDHRRSTGFPFASRCRNLLKHQFALKTNARGPPGTRQAPIFIGNFSNGIQFAAAAACTPLVRKSGNDCGIKPLDAGHHRPSTRPRLTEAQADTCPGITARNNLKITAADWFTTFGIGTRIQAQHASPDSHGATPSGAASSGAITQIRRFAVTHTVPIGEPSRRRTAVQVTAASVCSDTRPNLRYRCPTNPWPWGS